MIDQFKYYTELIAYIASIIGFPLAFIIFWRQKKEDRKQVHLNSYSSVDEKFFDFLKVCTTPPELNCSLYSDDSIKLKKQEEIPRISIYEMLICVFERVHIYYSYKLKDSRMVYQEIGKFI